MKRQTHSDEDVAKAIGQAAELLKRLPAGPAAPSRYFWLSFADPVEGFLGSVVVRAACAELASFEARRVGCHPGRGQIAIVEFPPDMVPAEEDVNRLMTKAEALAYTARQVQ